MLAFSESAIRSRFCLDVEPETISILAWKILESSFMISLFTFPSTGSCVE
jgi:hypothetical protein